MSNAVSRAPGTEVGLDAGSPTPSSRSLENQLSFYASSNPTRRALHSDRKQWVTAAVRRAAAELVPARGLAMEIGPGAGLVLPVLATEFDEVVAVDLNPAFLDAAEALRPDHPNLRVVAADATRPIPGVDAADLVLCSEVLEHVPEPGRFVAGLAGLLAPGGVLVLTTPQRYSTVELAGRLLGKPGVKQLVQRLYGEAVVDLGHISLRTSRQVAERCSPPPASTSSSTPRSVATCPGSPSSAANGPSGSRRGSSVAYAAPASPGCCGPSAGSPAARRPSETRAQRGQGGGAKCGLRFSRKAAMPSWASAAAASAAMTSVAYS